MSEAYNRTIFYSILDRKNILFEYVDPLIVLDKG